jgi:hypothetical protein
MNNDVWVLIGVLVLMTVVFLINVRRDNTAQRDYENGES